MRSTCERKGGEVNEQREELDVEGFIYPKKRMKRAHHFCGGAKSLVAAQTESANSMPSGAAPNGGRLEAVLGGLFSLKDKGDLKTDIRGSSSTQSKRAGNQRLWAVQNERP